MPLILEGIVTTLNADGAPNVSPMGPIVARDLSRFTLKPFNTSKTYANLKRTSEGVLHVVDDVGLLARAAVNQVTNPAVLPAAVVKGVVLAEACRWYEFRIHRFDDLDPRAVVECDVVHTGTLREFFGFNRAKHAVLEAAILVTRIGILPDDQILADFARLEPLVEKTAGDQETEAFQFLKDFLHQKLASHQS